MLLLVLSYTILSSYIYIQNKESIVDITTNLMAQKSTKIVRHVQNLLENVAKVPPHLATLVANQEALSLANKELVSYLEAAIRAFNDVSALSVVAKDGSSLAIYRIEENIQYRSMIFKSLPKSYTYALQWIDRSKEENAEVTWIYQDDAGHILETKTVEASIDSRKSPWFQEVSKTHTPIWTKVWQIQTTDQPAIARVNPLFNDKGELFAVSAGVLGLNSIVQFLSSERITSHEKSMILTEDGNVIAASSLAEQTKISSPKNLRPVAEVDPLFNTAFHYYKKNRKETFTFQQNADEYLATFIRYVSPRKENWLIAIIVPASDYLTNILTIQKQLYSIFAIILLIAILFVTLFSRKISKPIVSTAKEANRLTELDFEDYPTQKSKIKEIFLMQSALRSMKSALKSFSCYVPKPIVKQLLQQGKDISLGGTKENLSLFLSDIYNFTTITEMLKPEELTEQLAEYLQTLSDIILEHEGTIDMYLGDAILAFWGAPTPIAESHRKICEAALQCMQAVNRLNTKWAKEKKPIFQTRIGLHEGSVIVGNVGTKESMNYIAMGFPMHQLHALEAANKQFHTNILVSAILKEKVEGYFQFRQVAEGIFELIE